MKRVVVGLVGPIASGKGFLAKYLVANGFSHFSLSDRVREEVDLRGLKRERETLQDVGNELRANFGGCVLAVRTATLIPEEVELVVVEGIRNPSEVNYLREVFGITIIGVDAAIELRLAWYLERAKSRGEDEVTAESFYRANARDLGEGEGTYGQQGGECLRLADIRLFNDGTDRFLREGGEALRRRLSLNLEGGESEKERLK